MNATITEAQMKAAAREALDAMGILGRLPICAECGQVGEHDHSAEISPTLTAATLIGLVMLAARGA